MKIFNAPETKAISESGAASKQRGPRARKHATLPEKKEISENEVREKLAAHVETSNTAKSKVLQQNSQQLGSGYLNTDTPPAPKIVAPPIAAAQVTEGPEESDSVKDAHLLLSDVKLNDPKDPNTQEKLKSVISRGAFNFNSREREALDKILNGN